MIFDTNVLIYISKQILRVDELLASNIQPKISVISYIEALGFPFATSQDKFFMEQICATCKIMHLNDPIVRESINLRAKYRIKLPDAIIYATALVENLPLLTNNIADFKALDNKVELIDPFKL